MARVQRAAINDADRMTEVPPIVHDVLRSTGQPLTATTRGFMEPQFGHDFSQVRVHTDTRASESARAVSAMAYTVGHDIVFGTGQFAPGTPSGSRLLAHELTHTIQQSSAGTSGLARAARLSLPGDADEREAETAANAVISGRNVNLNNSVTRTNIGGEPLQQAILLRRKIDSLQTRQTASIRAETPDEARASQESKHEQATSPALEAKRQVIKLPEIELENGWVDGKLETSLELKLKTNAESSATISLSREGTLEFAYKGEKTRLGEPEFKVEFEADHIPKASIEFAGKYLGVELSFGGKCIDPIHLAVKGKVPLVDVHVPVTDKLEGELEVAFDFCGRPGPLLLRAASRVLGTVVRNVATTASSVAGSTAVAVGGVVAGIAIWTGAGFYLLEDAHRKGDKFAIASRFAEGYADALADMSDPASDPRTQFLTLYKRYGYLSNWRNELQRATDEYRRPGGAIIGAMDIILQTGRAKAYRLTTAPFSTAELAQEWGERVRKAYPGDHDIRKAKFKEMLSQQVASDIDAKDLEIRGII